MPAANQSLLAELDRFERTLSERIGALRNDGMAAARVEQAQHRNWQSAAGWFALGVVVGIAGLKAFGVL